jgi:hypothetical protein
LTSELKQIRAAGQHILYCKLESYRAKKTSFYTLFSAEKTEIQFYPIVNQNILKLQQLVRIIIHIINNAVLKLPEESLEKRRNWS